MTDRLWLLQLTGRQINDDWATGTGEQLKLIVEHLASSTADCHWFVSDVLVVHAPWPVEQTDDDPQLIGDGREFIAAIQDIPQFLRGVFPAVPDTGVAPEWTRPYETESEPFLDLEPVRYEIRAFDTTWFEIYGRDKAQLDQLATAFGGIVQDRR